MMVENIFNKIKKGLIALVVICIIIFFVLVAMKLISPNNNCYYDVGENITCKIMTSGYETRFYGCSDGYTHVGSKYKKVCK